MGLTRCDKTEVFYIYNNIMWMIWLSVVMHHCGHFVCFYVTLKHFFVRFQMTCYILCHHTLNCSLTDL